MVFCKTLVDIWGIDFCRPALKSHQNVIHSHHVSLLQEAKRQLAFKLQSSLVLEKRSKSMRFRVIENALITLTGY